MYVLSGAGGYSMESKVWIYLIKPCKRVSVCEMEPANMGWCCDEVPRKFWMVIKEDGHVITAVMSLTSCWCLSSWRTITGHSEAPVMDLLVLPINLPSSNKKVTCPDGSHIHMISEPSLFNLNSRLK